MPLQTHMHSEKGFLSGVPGIKCRCGERLFGAVGLDASRKLHYNGPMQRAGANPDDMQMSDFLCDFCQRAWDGTFALVEGHKGSLICGECLTSAYQSLAIDEEATAAPGYSCTMCLEEREQAGWQSPTHAEAVICLRCCKQGATKLEKEMEGEWKRPGAN